MSRPPLLPRLNAVVIASRETAATLLETLAALQGAEPPPAVIDVVVNGNPALASKMLLLLASQQPQQARASSLRLWSLVLGDKAHAMNEYIHKIWPGNAPTSFVDGYVRVHADALALLAEALATHPDALAATGVPGSGRTAAAMRAQMRREGGLHGNLFILSSQTLGTLRGLNFRLPLGLYRTDATLGAALSFGLDPSKNGWEPLRFIRVEDRARWDVDFKAWWRPAELTAQWRRRQRQVQGKLENRAVRNLYAERLSPVTSLPGTTRDLVLGWQKVETAECERLLKSSRQTRRAFEKLKIQRDWSLAQCGPELVYDSGRHST